MNLTGVGRSGAISVGLLAALYTVLNAAKPLHIDDTAYHFYARQIAAHPLDPYGFTVLWRELPQPAMTVLAPPVLPYWLAAALKLCGERPFLWKLSLLPFALLLVGSLARLLARFAPEVRGTALWMTVLSPTFLPSFNLMLDVPALALGLAALTAFMGAVERGDAARAVLAGLIAALAMQTKYTALLVPVVMLAFVVTAGGTARWRGVRLWLLSVAVAIGLFAGWEGLLTLRYPEGSHFLFHLLDRANFAPRPPALVPLLTTLGGVASPLVLLGMMGLGAGVLPVVAAGLAAAAVAAVGLAGPEGGPGGAWPFERVLFTALGVALALVVVAVVVGLRRAGERPPAARRDDAFLLLWLAIEIAGYFSLTPFFAVRRVMGVVVATTILVARLAGLGSHRHGQRRLLAFVAAAGIALGLLFHAVDFREASARREAVDRALTQVRARDRAGTIWFVGHWGFHYYAERAGMRPVVPGESTVRAGDWLLIPDGSIDSQPIVYPAAAAPPQFQVEVDDRVALRTVWVFYGSGNGVPIERRSHPRVTIHALRATLDFVPQPEE